MCLIIIYLLLFYYVNLSSLSLSLSLPPGISDDISAESITVSSNCPVRITVLITTRPDNLLSLSLSQITKQKMAYPSRGLNCTHLQCFDAKAFLHMALRK